MRARGRSVDAGAVRRSSTQQTDPEAATGVWARRAAAGPPPRRQRVSTGPRAVEQPSRHERRGTSSCPRR
eukprot:3999396-Prymnesium_polylepis.1